MMNQAQEIHDRSLLLGKPVTIRSIILMSSALLISSSTGMTGSTWLGPDGKGNLLFKPNPSWMVVILYIKKYLRLEISQYLRAADLIETSAQCTSHLGPPGLQIYNGKTGTHQVDLDIPKTSIREDSLLTFRIFYRVANLFMLISRQVFPEGGHHPLEILLFHPGTDP
jgi:hypothetical protein